MMYLFVVALIAIALAVLVVRWAADTIVWVYDQMMTSIEKRRNKAKQEEVQKEEEPA